MPNPRANRPLTLDQVTADLKSFAQPAQAMFDMMAGALRGSAVGTAGLPGDLETLARMGVNAAGGSFNPAMPSRSGRAFQPVSEEPFFPSSEELAKRFPPTIPNGDPVRRKSAEPFEELGQFAPLPMSGKALKVLPYALGRGTGEVTKEAARMVNDAMLYGQGPLAKVTPQVQRMFIGPQAKVWNHSMAQVAESMEKAGADPVEIWQKTGTFRGADGKLRQEISDKPAQFFDADQIKQRAGDESQAIKDLQMRLLTDSSQKDLFPKLLTEAKKPIRAEVKQRKEALDEFHGPRTLPYRGNYAPIAFEHPELYEAYPELKKYLVSQGNRSGSTRGSLMGENIDIYEAGLRGDPRSTMLHEMQHAVQGIEDFAPGGNPAMAFAQPEAMKILEEMRLRALKPMSFEDYADRYSHLANKEKGYEEYLKSIPGIVKKMDRELQTEAAMEYYKRLAGEAEARATQERMNMSPSERQQIFPYGSYDVLEEDLIVKPPKNQLPTNEEELADGGSVHISDNPDTMMMELGDQHFAPGGAAVKMAKLLRAPAKTKTEIEAIAQRMTPQITGEYVRGSKGAKTVAGKTQKQFEREKTLEHDIRPTAGERPAVTPVDIESLKDNVMIGISGDPTITGQTVYGVAGRELQSPAPQHGGPLYGLGREDDAFWASNFGAASGVQGRVKEASDLYEAPVIGNYVKMGPDSYSYAQHFADTALQTIDPSKMTKRQIEGFNSMIRKGYPYRDSKGVMRQRVFPSFPGIESPEEMYLHMTIDPELRTHFGNLMQMPTVTEKFNLPSGLDVAHAVSEPDIRDLEIGVTGKALGRMKPEAGELKLSTHPTYTHDIPGEFIGGLKYPVPHDLMFPDTLKSVRENPKQAPQEFGSFKMVGPRQIIDPQAIDEIKQYEEFIKKYTGKKEGGEITVKPKKDGQKFKPGKKPDQILKHGQAMPRGKDPEADISQMAPMMMAGGGEVNADDLILEERKL